MSDNDLESRFPDMRPLKSLPALSTVNGFGCTVYGSRDYDPDTGTYVKTHCLCVLFIPLLMLGAYRVADAPQGWYFIGRVPLSLLAKAWNWLVILAILGGIGFFGWYKYSHTPDYLAGRKLAEGDRLAKAGQVVKAAQLYREVAFGGTDRVNEAMVKMKDLLEGPVQQASPQDAAAVFQIAVELRERWGGLEDLFDQGMQLAKKHAAGDPQGALAVMEAVAPVARDTERLNAELEKLLEPLVEKEPDNVDYASKLAVVYERQERLEKCEELLTPHLHRLGTTEGARILGHIYTQQGKFEQAHALLLPYAEGRLKQLHAAEQAYLEVHANAEKQVFEQLKKREVKDFNFKRYEKAGQVEQQTMVIEYIDAKIKDDPALKSAQEAVLREASVVPVALDLGIVLLRRAQGMADPAARRAELEKTEKTFLSIRGLAGQSNQYRLFLGQVYYWLGKHAEGRKLFDELLAAQQRNTEILLGVGRLLREVGAITEARALMEEAYNKETEPAKKQMAAADRALIFLDIDDEITWLRRADLAQSEIKAALSMAQGNKAMQEGRDQEAATHLRDAIDTYGRLPVEASTLNNGALAYFSLYRITGERETLDKGVEMLEKAIALRPSDSILLSNGAARVLEGALRDIIGPAIDFKVLKTEGSLGLLPYLYQDQAGKERYVQRVRKHAGVAKALAHFDRLMVLSPKKAQGYATASSIHHYTRDLEALRSLWKRLEGIELDLADTTQRTLDYYAGKDDAKYKKELNASLERYHEMVKTARKNAPGVTFAVAATTLVGIKTSMDAMGLPVDADELVALAEEAHQAAPSSATHSTLRVALLVRASKAIAQKEPAYAALVTRAQRSLGPVYLVSVALSQEGKLREAVLSNQDVQRVVTLELENRQKFPDSHDEWAWVMLRAAHPEEADKIAKGILKDEIDQLDQSLDRKLSPLRASVAYQAYWRMQIAGKEAEGVKILKDCAAQGVPMPFEVK